MTIVAEIVPPISAACALLAITTSAQINVANHVILF
jgi:hypothetical protein